MIEMMKGWLDKRLSVSWFNMPALRDCLCLAFKKIVLDPQRFN